MTCACISLQTHPSHFFFWGGVCKNLYCWFLLEQECAQVVSGQELLSAPLCHGMNSRKDRLPEVSMMGWLAPAGSLLQGPQLRRFLIRSLWASGMQQLQQHFRPSRCRAFPAVYSVCSSPREASRLLLKNVQRMKQHTGTIMTAGWPVPMPV